MQQYQELEKIKNMIDLGEAVGGVAQILFFAIIIFFIAALALLCFCGIVWIFIKFGKYITVHIHAAIHESSPSILAKKISFPLPTASARGRKETGGSQMITFTRNVLKDYKIGDYTYGNPEVYGKGILEIGNFCSIGGDVIIILGCEHHPDWLSTYPFPALFGEARHIEGHPFSKGPVIIGNDVWIGQKSTILSGVTIGNGAIIGAGSVVSKNVAPYSIVAGNPATHKKFRFPEEWCEYLNRKFKWWEWPIDTILKYVEQICMPPGEHLYEIRRQVKRRSRMNQWNDDFSRTETHCLACPTGMRPDRPSIPSEISHRCRLWNRRVSG